MSHRIDGRKLSRKQGPRLALFKNLTVSVLRYEKVQTTERSEEHTSELQSPTNIVCRLLLEKKECINLGAERAIHHNRKDFLAIVLEPTAGKGFFFLINRGPPRSTLFPHKALSR